ncbi:MAG TPA: thermonuclease family protein [Candidatus Dojkabacteria bacterium]|jgi:micrococcal nuclease
MNNNTAKKAGGLLSGILPIGIITLVFLVIFTLSENKTSTEENQDAGEVLSEINAGEYYEVLKVVDGDTIQVNIDGSVARIRLIGIDSPESVDPRTPVECFGNEASDYLKSILEDNSVRLLPDPTQGDEDQYGRLLRYVYIKNSDKPEEDTNIAELILQNGYAFEFTYDTPYQFQQKFQELEEEAMTNKRGLWNDANCSY